ncbi:hypothetical protein [Vibrio phage BUCT194]|uniref:Uncharacterized protein n=1 Tax=Vibrio phage BUCT194 TaxID=2859072 RepID=A0AAE8XFA6_9CAUD|nr:hypothetical protein PP741_gp009 [Vibrio phage BUCT194]UAW01116.1 hypothetical protein [Vibrio phage BUCT194]
MIKLILIGATLLNIDGHQVKQCQYRAPDSDNPVILTTYVPEWGDCKRVIKL